MQEWKEIKTIDVKRLDENEFDFKINTLYHFMLGKENCYGYKSLFIKCNYFFGREVTTPYLFHNIIQYELTICEQAHKLLSKLLENFNMKKIFNTMVMSMFLK